MGDRVPGSRFSVDQCALYASYGSKAVEHLLCAVCHDILDDPLVTPCDHHFCRSCCDSLRRSQIKTCPLCNKPTFASTGKRDAEGKLVESWLFSEPSKSFLRILEGTPMMCRNDGCHQMVPLGEYLHHVENQCDYRWVQCGFDNCHEKIRACDLANHMKGCCCRTVRCACCNETVVGGCEIPLCSPQCISDLRTYFKSERSKILEVREFTNSCNMPSGYLVQESRLEKNCMTNCIQLLQWQLLEAQRQIQSLKAELVGICDRLLTTELSLRL